MLQLCSLSLNFSQFVGFTNVNTLSRVILHRWLYYFNSILGALYDGRELVSLYIAQTLIDCIAFFFFLICRALSSAGFLLCVFSALVISLIHPSHLI